MMMLASFGLGRVTLTGYCSFFSYSHGNYTPSEISHASHAKKHPRHPPPGVFFLRLFAPSPDIRLPLPEPAPLGITLLGAGVGGGLGSLPDNGRSADHTPADAGEQCPPVFVGIAPGLLPLFGCHCLPDGIRSAVRAVPLPPSGEGVGLAAALATLDAPQPARAAPLPLSTVRLPLALRPALRAVPRPGAAGEDLAAGPADPGTDDALPLGLCPALRTKGCVLCGVRNRRTAAGAHPDAPPLRHHAAGAPNTPASSAARTAHSCPCCCTSTPRCDTARQSAPPACAGTSPHPGQSP